MSNLMLYVTDRARKRCNWDALELEDREGVQHERHFADTQCAARPGWVSVRACGLRQSAAGRQRLQSRSPLIRARSPVPATTEPSTELTSPSPDSCHIQGSRLMPAASPVGPDHKLQWLCCVRVTPATRQHGASESLISTAIGDFLAMLAAGSESASRLHGHDDVDVFDQPPDEMLAGMLDPAIRHSGRAAQPSSGRP